MEEISSKKDIQLVLSKFYELGIINDNLKKEYEKKILSIVSHTDLNKYYQDELKSCNEREIISKTGKILVPDRLVFLNNSDVVLIDYKTGSESLSHLDQLNKYESVLNEMNFKVVEKILIYAREKIKIKFF